MKKIRLNLRIATIAFLIMLTFSFSPTLQGKKVAVVNFYVNPDGSRGTQVSGTDQCSDLTTRLCSQEYDTTTGLPTGNPEKMHYGTRP
ncbi:hypothetical protein BCY89_05740 [Sphingobacterium siyangense]|uniref:Uncharacterized protein n=1 Tax=Sphingobacterium siyangense TaxID=459529 RepID=A0A420FWB6_9SPHI|nr:hypothetical protein [Sphingobacterium siyangense]RKF37153.1 hypothetical protein BCY89_05740 [Sphingobacterium siyangense]